MKRFTMDGSDALESHIAGVCARVADGVAALVPASGLEAIVLGGGYGRGEGGVLRTGGGDAPYNDLEFYVFVRGSAILAERTYRHPLHELGERLSPEAGLEVEFKVLTAAKLRRSPPSMFYYDLCAGHRLVAGDASVMGGCGQHLDASRLPLHEATRLLFNRCSGLLYSKERLNRRAFESDDADFVARNLAKAQLAFGDVLLTAHGRYHWSCRERHDRLAQMDLPGDLAWAVPLKAHHELGVEFKLHPVRSAEGREALAARHAVLSALGARLWTWLETKRLGVPFDSPRSYAMSDVNKCPETLGLRNALVNLRSFGARGLLRFRYPRERLFHALALLLWVPSVLEDAALRARVCSALGRDAADLRALVEAYRMLWGRFN